MESLATLYPNHEGEVALVTGGASGLGKATAQRLSMLGIIVYAMDLPGAVEKAAQEQTSAELNVRFRCADVTNEKEVANVMEEIKTTHKRLDYVVNCAGILHVELVCDVENNKSHDLATFTKVIQVNLIGTFNVVRLAMPLMLQNKASEPDGQRGVVINTSSNARSDAPQGVAAYAASKAAVSGMTMPLAKEFGPYGIRIVAIAPGCVDTPMIADLRSTINAYAAQTQFPKRVGHAHEFASMVQAIIDNPLINATTIRLDGGYRNNSGADLLEKI